jgi:hypothetical protein
MTIEYDKSGQVMNPSINGKLYLTTGQFSSTMHTSSPLTNIHCKACGEEAWLSGRGLCTAYCEKNIPQHIPEEQFKRYYEKTKHRRIE